MDDLDSEWQRKGGTLGDKTARKEFGLTQDEIVQAIRAGKLQYRHNSIHGNRFLRLLRREVEALVKKRHGADFPEGTASEDGAGADQPRAQAAEEPGCQSGGAEGSLDEGVRSPRWRWLVRQGVAAGSPTPSRSPIVPVARRIGDRLRRFGRPLAARRRKRAAVRRSFASRSLPPHRPQGSAGESRRTHAARGRRAYRRCRWRRYQHLDDPCARDLR